MDNPETSSISSKQRRNNFYHTIKYETHLFKKCFQELWLESLKVPNENSCLAWQWLKEYHHSDPSCLRMKSSVYESDFFGKRMLRKLCKYAESIGKTRF